jgi:hypothetical protein
LHEAYGEKKYLEGGKQCHGSTVIPEVVMDRLQKDAMVRINYHSRISEKLQIIIIK